MLIFFLHLLTNIKKPTFFFLFLCLSTNVKKMFFKYDPYFRRCDLEIKEIKLSIMHGDFNAHGSSVDRGYHVNRLPADSNQEL